MKHKSKALGPAFRRRSDPSGSHLLRLPHTANTFILPVVVWRKACLQPHLAFSYDSSFADLPNPFACIFSARNDGKSTMGPSMPQHLSKKLATE